MDKIEFPSNIFPFILEKINVCFPRQMGTNCWRLITYIHLRLNFKELGTICIISDKTFSSHIKALLFTHCLYLSLLHIFPWNCDQPPSPQRKRERDGSGNSDWVEAEYIREEVISAKSRVPARKRVVRIYVNFIGSTFRAC